ncbi:hypothetical protein POM88_045103 [Heracleum sosnowskyi]|uniref:Ribosomal protein S7 n=1 Tax=Heracleum sosnowskyi TaxID=360622 RepID=A0AAD8H6M8_9APIA|nr:hypothetical protein POM88_045103 [Heracleum sosnowskyi]
MPHTSGRYQAKRFRKALCPLVERLTNSLMMHGRNNGKKLLDVHIVKHAMEIIHLLTDQNPIQVIVDSVINSGRREDATRIGSAGVVRRQAVDISPLRRVNQAIYLLTTVPRILTDTLHGLLLMELLLLLVYLNRNGIKQRKNSWQDGVLGTNCAIPPNSNYTYKFQTKDQIGGYTYFPSTLMHKAAGGFGALNICARPRIPVPYSLPAGDFSLLIGDWRTSSHKIFRRLNFMPSFLPGLPKDYAICTGTTAFLAACATQIGKSHVDEVQGIVEFIQAAKRVKIS